MSWLYNLWACILCLFRVLNFNILQPWDWDLYLDLCIICALYNLNFIFLKALLAGKRNWIEGFPCPEKELNRGLSLPGKRNWIEGSPCPEKEFYCSKGTFKAPPSHFQGTVYSISFGYGGSYAKIFSWSLLYKLDHPQLSVSVSVTRHIQSLTTKYFLS